MGSTFKSGSTLEKKMPYINLQLSDEEYNQLNANISNYCSKKKMKLSANKKKFYKQALINGSKKLSPVK